MHGFAEDKDTGKPKQSSQNTKAEGFHFLDSNPPSCMQPHVPASLQSWKVEVVKTKEFKVILGEPDLFQRSTKRSIHQGSEINLSAGVLRVLVWSMGSQGLVGSTP